MQGKVRDTYRVADSDKIVIVTTDRQSAFDRILASIPFKVTASCPRTCPFSGLMFSTPGAIFSIPAPQSSLLNLCLSMACMYGQVI